MEKAIKRAIEGGYILGHELALGRNAYYPDHILLDPDFWKCLGKAEGWDDDVSEGNNPDWQAYWHKFIDHLAEGKDINDFFNNLLK